MSDKLRSLRSLLESLSNFAPGTPGYLQIQSRIEALFAAPHEAPVKPASQCRRSMGYAKGRCEQPAINEVETVVNTFRGGHSVTLSYWTPVCAHHTPSEDRNVRPLARSA